VFERAAIVRTVRTQHAAATEDLPFAAGVSAVTMACADAAARLVDLPLHALLGGSRDVDLRTYASGPFFRRRDDPTQHYAEVTQRLVEQGFDAIKLKIGLGAGRDAQAVERVFSVASDARLMVDANRAYDLSEAKAVERKLAAYPLVWLEEPVAPNPSEYVRLREGATLPIAGGESIRTRYEAHRWLVVAACDFFQPDIAAAGGPDDAVAISTLADSFGVTVAPHCFGLGIGLAASLHWATVLAEPPIWIEVDATENPIRDALLAGCDWFRSGGADISVPDSPGLGVDPEAISSFRVA
jgi:D-galactarolactone cycloisomerase